MQSIDILAMVAGNEARALVKADANYMTYQTDTHSDNNSQCLNATHQRPERLSTSTPHLKLLVTPGSTPVSVNALQSSITPTGLSHLAAAAESPHTLLSYHHTWTTTASSLGSTDQVKLNKQINDSVCKLPTKKKSKTSSNGPLSILVRHPLPLSTTTTTSTKSMRTRSKRKSKNDINRDEHEYYHHHHHHHHRYQQQLQQQCVESITFANTNTLSLDTSTSLLTTDAVSSKDSTISLTFAFNLNTVMLNWTENELNLFKRRLVTFYSTPDLATSSVVITHLVTPPLMYQRFSITMSCIYWDNPPIAFTTSTTGFITASTSISSSTTSNIKSISSNTLLSHSQLSSPSSAHFYFTSVDFLHVLQGLLQRSLDITEKGRVRRLLEVYSPITLRKTCPCTRDMFHIVMEFPEPRPRTIEKEVKVYRWEVFTEAVTKIVRSLPWTTTRYRGSSSIPISLSSTAPWMTTSTTNATTTLITAIAATTPIFTSTCTTTVDDNIILTPLQSTVIHSLSPLPLTSHPVFSSSINAHSISPHLERS